VERPTGIPSIRVRRANARDERPDGDFVLYWMTAFRRRGSNFALEHAALAAQRLRKPLLVLEPLRVDYPWASERLHRFVIDGMVANARAFAAAPVTYHPWVEREPGAGRGLIETLARRACLVVGDDYPSFFLPRAVARAAADIAVRLDAVDANGLLPLRAAPRTFARAYDFRRFLQRELPAHLLEPPAVDPLRRLDLPRLRSLPPAVTTRWPAAEVSELERIDLGALPIDHEVRPTEVAGGAAAARSVLRRFVDGRLPRYDVDRLDLDEPATSGLSPYLHFGHLGAHEVLQAVADHEDWNPSRLGAPAGGSARGWWGMSPAAETFLDQLSTWRELGFNFSARVPEYDRYESLPEWARHTLEKHQADRRPALYTLDELEAAATGDPIWNAAQRELLECGRIHNYLRMLWGKKILEWSATPRDALEVMIRLNDRWALDGRDPNSYSGIFWCLGRYDRPWAPERPIFGSVRFMSSESARRKLRMKRYLERFGEDAHHRLFGSAGSGRDARARPAAAGSRGAGQAPAPSTPRRTRQ
jgi:deoxyribodipyrimidine photo-lyase